MNETKLRVVCKSCGAEVSPYVTECPYCGARVRKRAPRLERRDGGIEATRTRRELRHEKRRQRKEKRQARIAGRPVVTWALILIPAAALLVRVASGGDLEAFGAVAVPFESGPWRFLTAQFAYLNVGYLFVVSLALAIFAPGLERKLGIPATAVLLVACGALGTMGAWAIEEQTGTFGVIAGGNGMALGAIAAWFVVYRQEATRLDEELDSIGVLVSATVILLLPVVIESADFWSAITGGAIGALAGVVAARARA
ncbi:MAG: rhomboid family intramembrane serine protease [Solirubrobacterales bacterium]